MSRYLLLTALAGKSAIEQSVSHVYAPLNGDIDYNEDFYLEINKQKLNLSRLFITTEYELY